MDSSATDFGGPFPFVDATAVMCGTLDDNNRQNRDPNDSHKSYCAQHGLLSGLTAIRDGPLVWSAAGKDNTVVQDSQDTPIGVEETQCDRSTVYTYDIAGGGAAERDNVTLEKRFEHLVQDQLAAAADVQLDQQSTRESSCAGVPGPEEVADVAMQPSVQYKSQVPLMTQTTKSNDFTGCTDSVKASVRQVDSTLEDRHTLHHRARRALAAMRTAQWMAAEAAPDSTMAGGGEAQAARAIAEWDSLHGQLASSQSRHQEQMTLLQEKITEREKEATELQSQYKDAMGRLLREAVDPKTGKGIPVARITALEQSLLLKEHAADTARFRVLHLRAKLHRLQGLQVPRGAGLGLHLVDFEQLKGENAHLSDKIEDRGRQLANAQKQSHAALNVLAHVKEKHHLEKRKCAELQAALSRAQEQLQVDKERARSAVEQQLKRKTRQMKLQEAKLLQDPTLMANFQELLVVREQWTSKVALLIEKHAATMSAP